MQKDKKRIMIKFRANREEYVKVVTSIFLKVECCVSFGGGVSSKRLLRGKKKGTIKILKKMFINYNPTTEYQSRGVVEVSPGMRDSRL